MKIAFTYPKNNGLVSRLISWVTKSKWSHVLLIVDDALDDDPIILESSAYGGVKLNILSKYSDSYNFEIYETIDDHWDINMLRPYIGSKYGYFQILGFALSKLFGLKKNPFGQGVICSEFVLLYLINSPYKMDFHMLQLNKTSPEDLYRIISKSPNFKLIQKQ